MIEDEVIIALGQGSGAIGYGRQGRVIVGER